MMKKRGNREGSIYKRKNGTYRAQITVSGKRIGFSAKTRKECQEWMKKIISQVDNGLTYSGAQTNFNDYLEGWLVTIKTTLRPTTHYQYEAY